MTCVFLNSVVGQSVAEFTLASMRHPTSHAALIVLVRTHETSCSSDSQFRRKLSETTMHRRLEAQRPKMVYIKESGGLGGAFT